MSSSNGVTTTPAGGQELHFDLLDAHTDDPKRTHVVPVPPRCADGAHVSSMEQYRALYERSITDPKGFWAEQARAHISWTRPFSDAEVMNGSFADGNLRWFSDGVLNVSYNCVDRHVNSGKGDQVAIIWEADEPGHSTKMTYKELLAEVCRVANVMLSEGVKKGDTVALYLPMSPVIAIVMLACARIGAIHSVIFGGFSAESLRDRILDAKSKWVFTANESRRGGKAIPLHATTTSAVSQCGDVVKRVFVYKHTPTAWTPAPHGLDVAMEDLLPRVRPYCPPEPMNAEDLLFLLYTSGSTGKPKGLAHTTAGYLLMATLTHRYVFDYREGDVYACVADAGWITGHSYIIYGPLSNGATTLMFESTPLYPDPSRYWSLVEEHKVTQFYTAPTAIRALMRFGSAPMDKHDLSSLRVIGTVGEPINPAAWQFYFDVVGKGRCSVVDTFWQTETGGIMITGLPGSTPMKPGSASLPFFGIKPQIRSKEGVVLEGNGISGILCIEAPWPSIARTIYGAHDRYMATYLNPYKGSYFTGDGAIRDADGYYWITGRVDDVMNVSGHRIGSAEVESALVAHSKVAEAAVVGVPHDIKGEALCCYVTLKAGVAESAQLAIELKVQVRNVIGAHATPDYIVLTSGLPKTRSGKIMRRILRKVIAGESESLGDISTLADPAVVAELISKVDKLRSEKAAAPAPAPAAAADGTKA